MVQDLKFRLILLYHLDLWWNWKACTWTNCKSPLPTLLLWIRFSSQKPSSQGPSTVHACPWTANFNSTPAPRIIQASQSHPPLATKGHLILLIVQGSLQSPCLLSLFPSRTTVWSCVMCGVLPGLWAYVTNKLLFISSVQYQVSCVWPSPYQGGKYSLFYNRIKEKRSTQREPEE